MLTSDKMNAIKGGYGWKQDSVCAFHLDMKAPSNGPT